jgi:hypothetical protein
MGETGTWQREQSTMLGSSKAFLLKVEKEAILAMLKGNRSLWRETRLQPLALQALDQ